MEIEVKLTGEAGNRASVRVEFPDGGFAINRIHVSEDERGRTRITLPLSERLHPYITLHGELKQTVFRAIEEAYQKSRDQARTPSAAEAGV